MIKAKLPHNEPDRLAALERYRILDTPSDAVLDGIAQAASDLCETPIALISLIDSTRQWFKSCIGLEVRETSRDVAFCSHAMLEPTELMVIEDTYLDDRFKDNPLVTGEPNIRFYAGKPLVTNDNYVLGTLCVIDDKPRTLSKAQLDGISRLAQVVVDLLQERQGSKVAAIERAVEQSAQHGVVVADWTQQGTPIIYANHAVERITGYSTSELIGKNCFFLKGPDTDAEAVAGLHEAITAQKTSTVVLKNYRKNGTSFWNELTVSPIKDQLGNTVNYVAVLNDVTDQLIAQEQNTFLADVTAEAELALASQNRLAQFVEDSANEIYITDANTDLILNVNRAARDNMGYTQKELQQLKPRDFVERLTKKKITAFMDPLLTGKVDTQMFEAVHRRKDGSTYPVAVNLQLMRSQNAPMYAAIIQDITNSRHQEESIELRDRAIAALEVGLSITDATLEGTPIVYVNRALCELTGYSSEELIGQSSLMLQMDDQHQPEHLKLQQAKANGEAIQVVLNNTRKDGSHYLNELSVSPVHNVKGELTHYIGIHRDVTDKTNSEIRLRQAQKIDAIGQLSGGIAHDFNNLLSVIAANLDFLDLDLTDKIHRECLNEADNAVQMGARLSRRLLTFAKQGQLDPVVLNANEHVLNAIELLRSTIGDKIKLSCQLAPDLWHIHADSSEIENTVVNLAINARDAMPDGGKINVETKNVSFKSDVTDSGLAIKTGDYIRLSIKDNGIGMTKDIASHIFEPFFTTKEHGKGTGLGLSSIHGFVTQSGGHIDVTSDVGQGTTFKLYLPKHKGS